MTTAGLTYPGIPESGADFHRPCALTGPAGAAPAPVAERRPEPLPRAEQIAHRIDHGHQVIADRADDIGLARDELGEDLLDSHSDPVHNRTVVTFTSY